MSVRIVSDPDIDSLSFKAELLGHRLIIDGIRSQLNSVVWRDFLYQTGLWDPDAVYLLDGVVHGFRMIDKSSNISPYCVQNYGSCWSIKAFEKLNALICEEIAEGKLIADS